MNPKQRPLRGVLQAGGRGERMGSLTDHCPKPLLSVDGVPMVHRMLDHMLSAKIRKVTILVGWLGELVESSLLERSDLPADLELTFLREAEPRGNVGALSDLPSEEVSTVFAFADLVTDLDFSELVHRHRSVGSAITLTSHIESHRVRLGELKVEGDEVLAYREKPLVDFLICSGIAVFEANAMELVWSKKKMGISDLVSCAIDSPLPVQHWTHGAFWMDVNSPEELEQATEAVKERKHAK